MAGWGGVCKLSSLGSNWGQLARTTYIPGFPSGVSLQLLSGASPKIAPFLVSPESTSLIHTLLAHKLLTQAGFWFGTTGTNACPTYKESPKLF